MIPSKWPDWPPEPPPFLLSERPLTPNDLWATVYKHLGIDQNATILDHTGRPQFILPFGKPIAELL